MPKRVQRRRTKGWRMPAGAIYVGRPTKWANRFVIGHWYKDHRRAALVRVRNHAHAVQLFRADWNFWIKVEEFAAQALEELRGHDLVCWCQLDQPCHADVLLELANATLVADPPASPAP